MYTKIILVTEAAAGLGRLTANALAHGGHTVYAAMPDCKGTNKRVASDIRSYAREQGVDIRPIDLDLSSEISVENAVKHIRSVHDRIDVLVNNAPVTLLGPTEAFLPEQIDRAFQGSIIGLQRVMRAVLPQMRSRPASLVVWLVSSSAGGGVPPYLTFHCAINASMEAMATNYARDLSRWGIETAIVVPGLITSTCGNLQEAVVPDDKELSAQYEAGPYFGLTRLVCDRTERMVPPDALPGAAAGAVAMIVDTPFGERPFRTTVDPADDGSEIVFSVLDRVRNEMIRRLGFADFLRVSTAGAEGFANGFHKV